MEFCKGQGNLSQLGKDICTFIMFKLSAGTKLIETVMNCNIILRIRASSKN